jgi:hypothetical protein
MITCRDVNNNRRIFPLRAVSRRPGAAVHGLPPLFFGKFGARLMPFRLLPGEAKDKI